MSWTDPDDVDIERREWSPSPGQLAAYVAKDVEHARSNLALVRARAKAMPHDSCRRCGHPRTTHAQPSRLYGPRGRCGQCECELYEGVVCTGDDTLHSRRVKFLAQQGLTA